MNALIVYWSKFGNTQQIANVLAETFAAAGSARAMSMDRLTAADLRDMDLVVMGCPTHRMNLPEAVRPLLEVLPRRVLRHTPVAAYDTSYKMSGFLAHFTAAKKLAQKLRKLGGKQVVPPETFHVVEREGPLYDSEIERARAWAVSILEQVVQGSRA
jgi:flavodoxin